MKLTESAVRHPITTLMVFIAVLSLGFISLGGVGLELFPDISLPTAVVYTVYPGVGPFEVESRVTKPLENALATMSGVETISSTSSEGFSFITAAFTWDTNMDTLVMDIREKVNAVVDTLPEDAKSEAKRS